MSRSKYALTGGFRIETIKSGHPAYSLAASTDRAITITVPETSNWLIMHGCEFIQTTGTAGNRQPQLSVFNNDGTVNTFFRNSPNVVAASSLLFQNYFAGTVDTTITNFTSNIAIPHLILDGGSSLVLKFASGIDAADTHTFALMVKELA